ncbi:orc1/cdc6 family replication initiation protein [Candidatus Woesearchaeota archaeon]|nr:orc1/cdc6 family replication initiation protein [Candidatus Woesearchaeota archaeon]
MGDKALIDFFREYVTQESLFVEKKALQSNYLPDRINHREEQITQVSRILAPALRLERPSNLFIYGKTGTGKTLVANYVSSNILLAAQEKNIQIKTAYVNCKLKKMADTEYRIISQLIRELGGEIAPTGLPTDEVYRTFFELLDNKPTMVLLVLDEIDQLVKKVGDEILYNLVRINEDLKKSQISILGISNDATFLNTADPRVKSSLSEEELIFPPYNAFQLQDILKERALLAFKRGVVEEGVIQKCAAYAAREHGDARRALELLRVSGEIAERLGLQKLSLSHVDQAEDKIEKDTLTEIIHVQPKQSQAIIYTLLCLRGKKEGSVLTGEIYAHYKLFSGKVGLRPLTQRRISDVLAELDMLGVINAKVISKGRYGRTREISLLIPEPMVEQIKKSLEEALAVT